MQTRARRQKPDHNSRVFTCEFNGLIQGDGGRSRVTMMPHASLSRRTPLVSLKGDISTAQ
jgi:hypothetical protein